MRFYRIIVTGPVHDGTYEVVRQKRQLTKATRRDLSTIRFPNGISTTAVITHTTRVRAEHFRGWRRTKQLSPARTPLTRYRVIESAFIWKSRAIWRETSKTPVSTNKRECAHTGKKGCFIIIIIFRGRARVMYVLHF